MMVKHGSTKGRTAVNSTMRIKLPESNPQTGELHEMPTPGFSGVFFRRRHQVQHPCSNIPRNKICNLSTTLWVQGEPRAGTHFQTFNVIRPSGRYEKVNFVPCFPKLPYNHHCSPVGVLVRGFKPGTHTTTTTTTTLPGHHTHLLTLN